MNMKLVIIGGSVRDACLNTRVVKFVQRIAQDRGFETSLLEPIKFPEMGLLKKPFHYYENPQEAPEFLRQMHDQLAEADCIICVTPEYNHSIPPAMSNVLDHFPSQVFAYKPFGVVTYSACDVKPIIVINQLRTLLIQLGALPVPEYVSMPVLHKLIEETGLPTDLAQENNLYMVEYQVGLTALVTMLEQLHFVGKPMKEQKLKLASFPVIHSQIF